MRLAFAVAIALAVAASAAPAFAATQQQGTMKDCAASWKTKSDAEKTKTKYTDYMSSCMKGSKTAVTPVPPPAPVALKAEDKKADAKKTMAKDAAGSAKCKDGTTVSYTHRSGTCSHHGGVATWL